MTGLSALIPLALLASALTADPGPAPASDPMLESFRAYCLAQPGRFDESRRAAEADGWRETRRGDDPEFDRIVDFAEGLQGLAASQHFTVSWQAYSKTISGRRLYLGLTDKRFGGKSERECAVSDLAAKAPVEEKLVADLLGEAPRQRSDSMGVKVAAWDAPATFPLVASVRSQLISSDSPLSEILPGGATLQMVTIVSIDT